MKAISIRVLTLLALILTTIGCQKDDLETFSKKSNNHELFFNNISWLQKQFPSLQVHQTENRTGEFSEHLRAIQSKLRELDNTHGIIDRIIDQYGMPVWGRPLLPEAVGNAQYVYYFPLLHGSNELVNGVLKVTLNSEGQFNFRIWSDIKLYNLVVQDLSSEEILNWVPAFIELNKNLFEEGKEYHQFALIQFLNNNHERIKIRNRGCWDDVLVQTIMLFTISGNSKYDNVCPDVNKKYEHKGPRTIYAHMIPVTVRVWNPNCGGDEFDDSWTDIFNNNFINGSGANTNFHSPWLILGDKMLPWIEYCKNYSPSTTDFNDNISTDPDFDRLRDDICNKLSLISGISGLDLKYHLDLLISMELMHISTDDLKAILKNHNGQPYLEAAIEKYLNYLKLTTLPQITLAQYVDAYSTIYNWMAGLSFESNNTLSQQIGENLLLQILINNGTPPSWISYITKENLDKIYLFMSQHPALNLSVDEQIWLLQNMHELNTLNALYDNPYSQATADASAKIYLALALADMLNLTSDQVAQNNKELYNKIGVFLTQYGLTEHTAISSATWYCIFKTQYLYNQQAGFSDAISVALGPGFYLFIKAFGPTLNAYAQSQGYQFPSTSDQWFTLGAVLGPVILDLGTDFIPIVGEIKSFAKGINETLAGNYSGAGVEFLAAIAGVIPIGKLITRAGDVYNAAKTALKALKVVKVLASFSSTIFSKIKQLVNAGWEIVWDNGLNKLKFFKNQNLVGDIDPNGVQTISSVFFKTIIDASSFKNLNPKTLDNAPSGNYISKNFINENANKFNVTEPGLKSKFDDIIDNGDQYGRKTENLIKEVIEDGGNSGWTHYDGSYGSNNGFDGVFIKGDEVIINESKQWTSGGVTLAGQGSGTPPWPAQMTDDWVEAVRFQLLQSNDPSKIFVAEKILQAKESGKLTKIVTFVDRTTPGNSGELLGGINIIKVN